MAISLIDKKLQAPYTGYIVSVKRILFNSKGFTLVELLVAIAILGILVTATLFVLNPIDKINAGNDAKVLTDGRNVMSAVGVYYSDNGTMPDTTAKVQTEMNAAFPTKPGSYADYIYAASVANNKVVFCGQLKSAKSLGSNANGFALFTTDTGQCIKYEVLNSTNCSSSTTCY